MHVFGLPWGENANSVQIGLWQVWTCEAAVLTLHHGATPLLNIYTWTKGVPSIRYSLLFSEIVYIIMDCAGYGSFYCLIMPTSPYCWSEKTCIFLLYPYLSHLIFLSHITHNYQRNWNVFCILYTLFPSLQSFQDILIYGVLLTLIQAQIVHIHLLLFMTVFMYLVHVRLSLVQSVTQVPESSPSWWPV